MNKSIEYAYVLGLGLREMATSSGNSKGNLTPYIIGGSVSGLLIFGWMVPI